jgi:hypothetical protein
MFLLKEIDIYIYKQYKMDYKNGKIYTIRSYQTDDIYIGSTTQTLTKRLSTHKGDFKRWKNGKRHYTTSYEIIKYGDAYIELLELCPCDTKMELCRREGELIRSMDCVNKEIAGRTPKEYYQENKEKIKERNKEYRDDNNEMRKEKLKCECGGRYTYTNKSLHFKTKKHLKFVNQV